MGGLSALLWRGPELAPLWMLVASGARVLLAIFFVFLAGKNLTGDPQMISDFERWGYPGWFRQFTALLQLAGAALLIPTASCFLGAALLAAVLLGAVATHLRHDPLLASTSPLVFLIAVIGTSAWFRPEILR